MSETHNKLVEIKLTKTTLCLYPVELLNNLPADVLAKGIKRGKGILRVRQSEKREQKRLEKVDR